MDTTSSRRRACERSASIFSTLVSHAGRRRDGTYKTAIHPCGVNQRLVPAAFACGWTRAATAFRANSVSCRHGRAGHSDVDKLS
jgi:hypothetical protein